MAQRGGHSGWARPCGSAGSSSHQGRHLTRLRRPQGLGREPWLSQRPSDNALGPTLFSQPSDPLVCAGSAGVDVWKEHLDKHSQETGAEGVGSTSKVLYCTYRKETSRPWKDSEMVEKTLARDREA